MFAKDTGSAIRKQCKQINNPRHHRHLVVMRRDARPVTCLFRYCAFCRALVSAKLVLYRATLEEVVSSLDDPFALTYDNPGHSAEEARFISLEPVMNLCCQ